MKYIISYTKTKIRTEHVDAQNWNEARQQFIQQMLPDSSYLISIVKIERE